MIITIFYIDSVAAACLHFLIESITETSEFYISVDSGAALCLDFTNEPITDTLDFHISVDSVEFTLIFTDVLDLNIYTGYQPYGLQGHAGASNRCKGNYRRVIHDHRRVCWHEHGRNRSA